MKKQVFRLIWLVIALILVLCGCKTEDEEQNAISIDFSDRSDCSVQAFLDEKIIYRMRGSSQYYVLDPKTDTEKELGSISDFSIGSASFAVSSGKYYAEVTNSDRETILYEIDYKNYSITPVDTCYDISPLVYLYKVPDGILRLKTPSEESGRTTFFDLFHPETGDTEVVLQASENDFYGNAAVYNNTLFVLTSHLRPNAHSEWVLQSYSLETYQLIDEIDLKAIESYLTQGRVAEMEVFGNYIYFANLSEQGIIAEIANGKVTPLVERQFLRAAKCFNQSEQQKERLFYIRTSDECFVLHFDTGEISSFNAKLHDGYDIQYVMIDGDKLLMSEEKISSSKFVNDKEILHVYDYHDFVNQKNFSSTGDGSLC